MILKKIYKTIIYSILIFFLLPGCLPRPKPQTGDFSGKVVDSYTYEPVPGVAMKIGEMEITTDEDGKFSIASLIPGDYQLTLERDWYNQSIQAVHHIEKQNSLVFSIIPLPIEGKILYSGNGTHNWEIYELDLSRRLVSQLTHMDSSEINPEKYSENQILLQSTFLSRNTDNYDLFSFDRTSQECQLIYSSPEKYNDQHPTSLMLGNTIIFQSNGEKIYSCDFSGKNAKQIIEKGQNPVMSPKGTQIAYADTSNHLCVANIDGTGIRTINHPGKINNPCWSPDGKMIAVELWQETGGPRYIYIMNADGTGQPQRVTYGSLKGDQHKHPCWSSDGTMIFFSANIIYSSRFDIYAIRVSDGQQGKMSWVMVSRGSGDKEYPSWAF
ncbi:MAG TPA: hypothetical protein DDW50_08285 [Firmicutes bacterium]|jgi:Tol biopolymer transport system component|nr:hypothetical protein [Bacillota bacterium]